MTYIPWFIGHMSHVGLHSNLSELHMKLNSCKICVMLTYVLCCIMIFCFIFICQVPNEHRSTWTYFFNFFGIVSILLLLQQKWKPTELFHCTRDMDNDSEYTKPNFGKHTVVYTARKEKKQFQYNSCRSIMEKGRQRENRDSWLPVVYVSVSLSLS